MQTHSRDFNNREHTQKTFLSTKTRKGFHNFLKVSFFETKNNRKDNIERSRKFFYCFEWCEEPSAPRQEHWPLHRFTANIQSFSTHLQFGRTCRCITHGNVLNLWQHDNFLHIVEQYHVQNDPLDPPDYGLVSSVIFIWLLFVSVSPSVLFDHSHTSSFRVNHAVIFFQRILFHSETLQGCIPLAPVVWQVLSFCIIGSVLRPSLVGHGAWALYCRRSCALHWWREPRWLYLPVCLFLLPSHWVAFSSFSLARSSLDLRHRPLNPLGSVSLPWVSQSNR